LLLPLLVGLRAHAYLFTRAGRINRPRAEDWERRCRMSLMCVNERSRLGRLMRIKAAWAPPASVFALMNAPNPSHLRMRNGA
jgi:hypothetical protein